MRLDAKPPDLIQSHETTPAIPLADISCDGASTEIDGKYLGCWTSCCIELIKQVIAVLEWKKPDAHFYRLAKLSKHFLLQINFLQFVLKTVEVRHPSDIVTGGVFVENSLHPPAYSRARPLCWQVQCEVIRVRETQGSGDVILIIIRISY